MALRVLLADESSTIKKVFQLALQDFAVEVKPVNVGLDVAAVAQSFKPDIIFADVLLQKKNGYDVSLEIKQNTTLKQTPVVLMWSGFMDLDEDKMQASGADAQLEKPFDVKSLRALVQSLVPKTKDQNLASYLSFPKLPDFEENRAASVIAPPPPAPTAPAKTTSASRDWSMDQFDPPPLPTESEDFQAVNLMPETGTQFKTPVADDDDEPLLPPDFDLDKDLIAAEPEEDEAIWTQKDLGKFKVGTLDAELSEESEPNVNYIVPDDVYQPPSSVMAAQEDDLEIEIEAPLADGAPTGMYAREERREEADHQAKQNYVPPGEQRGKTVVLNFSLGEDGDESTAGSSVVNPDSALKKLTAQLNEEALAQIIEKQVAKTVAEQSRKIIEDAVWKILPDLTRQIVERELKKLIDEDDNLQP